MVVEEEEVGEGRLPLFELLSLYVDIWLYRSS